MDLERLRGAVAALVAAAGLPSDFTLNALSGTANNRVFRLDSDGSSTLLKAYFQHPDDQRDRCGAEFSFSSFAWETGIRCVAQPLACDPDNQLGLYEFVVGRRVRPGEVTRGMVDQALGFYRGLNRHRSTPVAKTLPMASEACFRLSDHLQCTGRRLQSLAQLETTSAVDREAVHFVRNALWGAWIKVAQSVGLQGLELGLTLEEEIPQEERCLSPSDFGFHNAILASDGRLRFIDFEYAGWDDPARLACDIFCQPAVPVPFDYFDWFVDSVTAELSNPRLHRQRLLLLLPVYRLKWCCILLNEFLPVGRARRRFAQGGADHDERKASQLEKARQALENAGLEWRGSHRT